MPRIELTDLPGWAADDHAAALGAYLRTAASDDPAHDVAPGSARAFFEKHFKAELVAEAAELTGYFEPVYEGALSPSAAFPAPIHAVPEGWAEGEPYASRREILERGLLEGCELAWLRTPLDAFLLQVQGSGRVRLEDGSELRLGYAGKNGKPYVSLGKLLLERGEVGPDDISMQAIRAWYSVHNDTGNACLMENPCYVFFKRLDALPADLGPIGTAGVPLTAERSVAVDPSHTRLGSLVYLDLPRGELQSRLCVAQDTGGAIKGPGRTDLYCGTGDASGEIAGRLYTTIRLFHLIPRGAA